MRASKFSFLAVSQEVRLLWRNRKLYSWAYHTDFAAFEDAVKKLTFKQIKFLLIAFVSSFKSKILFTESKKVDILMEEAWRRRL